MVERTLTQAARTMAEEPSTPAATFPRPTRRGDQADASPRGDCAPRRRGAPPPSAGDRRRKPARRDEPTADARGRAPRPRVRRRRPRRRRAVREAAFERPGDGARDARRGSSEPADARRRARVEVAEVEVDGSRSSRRSTAAPTPNPTHRCRRVASESDGIDEPATLGPRRRASPDHRRSRPPREARAPGRAERRARRPAPPAGQDRRRQGAPARSRTS